MPWGSTPLQAELAKIAALDNYQDLAVYFAEANKLGINVPITLHQYVDMKDNSIYMMYTWQGGLGLPDREYYFKDDEKSEEIRQAYVQHIRTMFDLAGLPDGESAAQTIMALETRIANEHMLKEKTRDLAANVQQDSTGGIARPDAGFFLGCLPGYCRDQRHRRARCHAVRLHESAGSASSPAPRWKTGKPTWPGRP